MLVVALCLVFWLCIKYFGNRWMDLRQIHREDVLVSRLDEIECQGQRSKMKVTTDKFPPHWKCIVRRSLQIPSCSSRQGPFRRCRGDGSAQRRPACGLCLVKHLCSSWVFFLRRRDSFYQPLCWSRHTRCRLCVFSGLNDLWPRHLASIEWPYLDQDRRSKS